jgi:Tfp pilus assembly protein PilN
MMNKKKYINLLPNSSFEKSLAGKIFFWALTIGRHIIISIELVTIISFLLRFKLDADLVKLNDSINEKKMIIKTYQNTEQNLIFLQKRLQVIKELKNKQLQAVQKIDAIAKATPKDIYLTNLEIQPGSLTMAAVSLSDYSLATFLAGLQKSEQFDQLNLDNLSTGGSRKPEIEFTLKANIKTTN